MFTRSFIHGRAAHFLIASGGRKYTGARSASSFAFVWCHAALCVCLCFCLVFSSRDVRVQNEDGTRWRNSFNFSDCDHNDHIKRAGRKMCHWHNKGWSNPHSLKPKTQFLGKFALNWKCNTYATGSASTRSGCIPLVCSLVPSASSTRPIASL